MIEVLAEQIRAEMVQDIHQENEGICQELLQLEKHRRRPVKLVVSKHEQQLPPITLKGIIEDAMDQATREEGLSRKKKKMWLVLAERLEEAHRLGIYKEPVNTIFVASSVLSILLPSITPLEKLSHTNTKNQTNQK